MRSGIIRYGQRAAFVTPYDMSAMDGYAICKVDVDRCTTSYAVGQDIYAGEEGGRVMEPGIALPISTSPPAPGHCDTVVPQERAERHGGLVRLSSPPAGVRHIRREGEDAREGDIVLRPRTLLTPAALGALASFGVTQVDVFKKPRAALLVIGNEVSAQICDASGPAISAALGRRKVEITRDQPGLAFSFGLIEIAEYRHQDGQGREHVVMQPRCWPRPR